jgi:hypothetical protein
MAVISVSNSKPVEETNLEAHVALCKQRHMLLEEKLNEIIEQNLSNKRMIFGAAISFVTCGVSGLFALVMHLAGKLI